MTDVVIPEGCEWRDPPPRAGRGQSGTLYGRTYEEWVEICKLRPGAWLFITAKEAGINGARRKAMAAMGLELRVVSKRTDGANGTYIRAAPPTIEEPAAPAPPHTQADDAKELYRRAVERKQSDPIGVVADSLGITRAKAKLLLGVNA